MLILQSVIVFIVFLYYLRKIYTVIHHHDSETHLYQRYQYLLKRWKVPEKMMRSGYVNVQSYDFINVLWDFNKQLDEFIDESSKFPAFKREREDMQEKQMFCLNYLSVITQAKLQKTSYGRGFFFE